MIIAPEMLRPVKGLPCGWIIRGREGSTPAKNAMQHYRQENGFMLCSRVHGPAIKNIVQFSKEPKGRQQVCPDCTIKLKKLRKLNEEKQRMIEEARKEGDTEVIEQLASTSQEFYTHGEIAELLDRPYGTIATWTKKAELGFDRNNGAWPASSLPKLEALDKTMARKPRRSKAEIEAGAPPKTNGATNGHSVTTNGFNGHPERRLPPGVVLPERPAKPAPPEPEVLKLPVEQTTTASTNGAAHYVRAEVAAGFYLFPEHHVYAAMKKMTHNEFIAFCVKTVIAKYEKAVSQVEL